MVWRLSLWEAASVQSVIDIHRFVGLPLVSLSISSASQIQTQLVYFSRLSRLDSWRKGRRWWIFNLLFFFLQPVNAAPGRWRSSEWCVHDPRARHRDLSVQHHTAANETDYSSLHCLKLSPHSREAYTRLKNPDYVWQSRKVDFTYTKTPKSRTRMPISKASSRMFFLRSGGDTFMILR